MEIKGRTIAIGILARDCIKYLRENIRRVEQLGAFFKDYQVIIYENDSKDGTDVLIRQWIDSNPKVHAINEPLKYKVTHIAKEKLPRPDMGVPRIEKMVFLRNRILDEVHRLCSAKAISSPDYFCFIDIDVESFRPESIPYAIENAPSDWGGLMANGHFYLSTSNRCYVKPPFQYDSYAFVQLGVDPFETGDWIVSHYFGRINSYAADVLQRKFQYLPCRSAFNGIGIYKWNIIKDFRYRVEQNKELQAINACFCEHVGFNGDVIKEGYTIYQVRDIEVIYYHQTMKWSDYKTFFHRIIKAWFLLKFKKFPISTSQKRK